ncbi:MAG: hypothetical protein EXR62_13710 [Chloroflexi bacterium]|nr:hypothetical protein [Chloroflexota bacterium]
MISGILLLAQFHWTSLAGLTAPETLLAPTAGIVFDSASKATPANAQVNSLTWSHTVGNGNNRILIVGVSLTTFAGVVNTVTYNGTPLAKIGEGNSSQQARLEMWQLS